MRSHQAAGSSAGPRQNQSLKYRHHIALIPSPRHQTAHWLLVERQLGSSWVGRDHSSSSSRFRCSLVTTACGSSSRYRRRQ